MDIFLKATLIARTKYFYYDTNKLIDVILNGSSFLSSIAKEEFLKRDLSDLDLDDSTLMHLINKLTIEDFWAIANQNGKVNNKFVNQVIVNLNATLDYYQIINSEDFLLKKNGNL